MNSDTQRIQDKSTSDEKGSAADFSNEGLLELSGASAIPKIVTFSCTMRHSTLWTMLSQTFVC
ncbi:TPA: hypothetical protein ACH3X1_001049 [Trebouxia sp. C0004]